MDAKFGLTGSLIVALLLAACGSAASPTATPPPTATTRPPAQGTSPVATATPAAAQATATATTPPKVQPKMGGTVRLVYWVVQNINDPHKIGLSAPTSFDTYGLMTNTVLLYDWDKGIPGAGGLAESWEWKSPTEIIIKLKKGIRFQQESMAKGREMDSADAVASLERARKKDAPFTLGLSYQYVTSYEAVDKNTVRATLSKPDANYLYYLAVSTAGVVLPREMLEKSPDNLAVPEAMYGTGAFVWSQADYRPDVSGAVNRNPNYGVAPGQPYLDRVEWVTVADVSSRTAAVRTGQIDVGSVPALEVDQFRKAGFRIMNGENHMVTAQHLAFNTKVAPTNDPRVRKALHLVLDREELRGIVSDGYGCVVIIMGCWSEWFLGEKEWSGQPGFRADKTQDIKDAKALLAAAGVDPTKTTLIMHSSAQNVYKVHYEQAVAIKGMLERNLGLRIDQQLKPYTAAAMVTAMVPLANVASGGFGNLVIDFRVWDHFHTKGLSNASLWSDPKTDALIEAQANELDVVKRKAILQQIQRYLLEDSVMPVAPTVRNFEWFAVNPKLRDYKASAHLGTIYAWQLTWGWLDK